jgi:hypothetical protein
MSGDQLLVPAAAEAVKQREYRLNGEKLEMATAINVVFSL